MDGYDPPFHQHHLCVDGAISGVGWYSAERPFLARITNQFGGPVAGVRVDWYILTGRGSASDSTDQRQRGMLCNTEARACMENIRASRGAGCR
jgi:hypothetical protein